MKHFGIVILALIIGQVFGQTDTSTIYKDLKAKTFYSVRLNTETKKGITTYEVNEKQVPKSIYDNYLSTMNNIENCCPCLLKIYDENNVLIKEKVSCTDCGVGYFKEFYANGKIKTTGRYKENPTRSWKNIWERGYCNVKEGEWIYFNDQGDKLYSEFWNNNEFIRQVPEQDSTEIWKVELTLNGEKIEGKKLTFEELKKIIITPKFKNRNKTLDNLRIKFQVSAVGYRQNEKTFTLENYSEINVAAILAEVNIPKTENISYDLSVWNNEKVIASFELNLTQ